MYRGDGCVGNDDFLSIFIWCCKNLKKAILNYLFLFQTTYIINADYFQIIFSIGAPVLILFLIVSNLFGCWLACLPYSLSSRPVCLWLQTSMSVRSCRGCARAGVCVSTPRAPSPVSVLRAWSQMQPEPLVLVLWGCCLTLQIRRNKVRSASRIRIPNICQKNHQNNFMNNKNCLQELQKFPKKNQEICNVVIAQCHATPYV